jgi:hypothetical protein
LIRASVLFAEKLAHKGAFWHVQNSNIIPRKIVTNGAIEIVDYSRVYVTNFLG